MENVIDILILLTVFVAYALLHNHLKRRSKLQIFYSTLLGLLAFFYFAMFTSMSLCVGWSASDGEVASCVVPRIKNFAEFAFSFFYISSFMVFIPIIIPIVIAWKRTKRYVITWKEERKHTGFISTTTKYNTILSCISAFLLIAVPLLYLFLGSHGYSFDTVLN